MKPDKIKEEIHYLNHKITVLEASLFELKMRIKELTENETKNDD